ncbi:hypothetical protein ACC685_33370 [Rhizobium ruizarguesonis]
MEREVIRFECRPGWNGLIQQAANEIATFSASWNARIYGGKEKFGALYLFVGPFDNESSYDVLNDLVERYRKRSLTICEECGQRGRLRMGISIAATRCDDHAAFVAPFRDEDGEIIDLPPTGGPIWKDGRTARYSPSE